MARFNITQAGDDVILTVKVVPASSRTMVAGLLGDMLKIKVAVPPEKGKANHGLIKFVAKLLGIDKKAVKIISGQTSPVKQLRICGITTKRLLDKLDIAENVNQ